MCDWSVRVVCSTLNCATAAVVLTVHARSLTAQRLAVSTTMIAFLQPMKLVRL